MSQVARSQGVNIDVAKGWRSFSCDPLLLIALVIVQCICRISLGILLRRILHINWSGKLEKGRTMSSC